MGIIIAVGLVISFIALVYMSWLGASREHISIERVFDIVMISFILSILVARSIFVIANFHDYSSYGWSVFPFYIYEGKRIWLEVLPWRFLRFDEGVAFMSIVLTFITLVSAIPIILRKNVVTYIRAILPAFTVAIYVLIFSTLLNVVYLGVYSVSDIALLLVIFVVLFGILVVVYIFSEVKGKKYCISVYLLLLSIILSALGFSGLLSETSLYKSNLMAYILIIISAGICLYVWSKAKKGEEGGRRDEFLTQESEVSKRTASTRFNMTYTRIHKNEDKMKSLWEAFVTWYHRIIRKRDIHDNS